MCMFSVSRCACSFPRGGEVAAFVLDSFPAACGLLPLHMAGAEQEQEDKNLEDTPCELLLFLEPRAFSHSCGVCRVVWGFSATVTAAWVGGAQP
jgi:hypothetical protein